MTTLYLFFENLQMSLTDAMLHLLCLLLASELNIQDLIKHHDQGLTVDM